MGLEFKTCPSMVCLKGLWGTGKTQRLARRVASLLKDGVSTSEILVVCASPDAVCTFSRRLRSELSEGAGDFFDLPRIATARELALETLGSDDARAFTGCNPRMLLPFEVNVLIEDVKTTGVSPKRLREMLKFFYRSLTEMADDDSAWLYSEEEEDVYATLKRHLDATRSLIEPQIANLAVKYLRAEATGAAAVERDSAPLLSFAHVLVDDFTFMSAASQVLCTLLARESLWIAGNPAASCEVFDSYPYAPGLHVFCEMPQVEIVPLCASFCDDVVVEAQRSLMVGDESYDDVRNLACSASACDTVVAVKEFDTAEEDVRATALRIKNRVDGGISPWEICVATQNARWRRSLARELERTGVFASSVFDARRLSSDERNLTLCVPARALCALALAADSHDSLAWRVWCGFGDYLLGSRIFSGLAKCTEEEKLPYDELLGQLATESPAEKVFLGDDVNASDVKHVIEAYCDARSLLDEVYRLEGRGLLEHICHHVSGHADANLCDAGAFQMLCALCAPVGERDDARTLFDRAIKRLTFPCFDGDGVRIGTFAQTLGLAPKVLVLSGFVNGIFPKASYFDAAKASIEQRAKMHTKDVRLMACVLGKVFDSLDIDYFDRADIQTAVSLKMRIDRIGLKDGERVAYVSPSEMLQAIPIK